MPTTSARMFEGLFVRAFAVSASSQFGADLRRAGFDAGVRREHYKTAVWTRCLNVARRLLYPGQACELGWRALGRSLANGHLRTPGSAVLDGALRWMPVRAPSSSGSRRSFTLSFADAPSHGRSGKSSAQGLHVAYPRIGFTVALEVSRRLTCLGEPPCLHQLNQQGQSHFRVEHTRGRQHVRADEWSPQQFRR